MAVYIKLTRPLHFEKIWLEYEKSIYCTGQRLYCTGTDTGEKGPEEFRTLSILPKKEIKGVVTAKKRSRRCCVEAKWVRDNLDWTNIWTGPRSFLPSIVKMNIAQGKFHKKKNISKYGNTELMKIPNFLHLSPLAVEKHCNALKKFCTEWPKELENDEDIAKHFPISVITSDYCHSSPSIRDVLARVVSIQLDISCLDLDYHAKDKFLRLVGHRYDPNTNILTINTTNCPLKKQNYDYAMYLLTALFYESWKVEPWESNKTGGDMETYIFDERKHKKILKSYHSYSKIERELPDFSEIGNALKEYFDDEGNIERTRELKDKMVEYMGLEKFSFD